MWTHVGRPSSHNLLPRLLVGPILLCHYQVVVTIVELVRVALPLCLGKSCHVEVCCWWRGPGIMMIVAHRREETVSV